MAASELRRSALTLQVQFAEQHPCMLAVCAASATQPQVPVARQAIVLFFEVPLAAIPLWITPYTVGGPITAGAGHACRGAGACGAHTSSSSELSSESLLLPDTGLLWPNICAAIDRTAVLVVLVRNEQQCARYFSLVWKFDPVGEAGF